MIYNKLMLLTLFSILFWAIMIYGGARCVSKEAQRMMISLYISLVGLNTTMYANSWVLCAQLICHLDFNLSRYTSIGLDGHGVIRTISNSYLLKTLRVGTRGVERCPRLMLPPQGFANNNKYQPSKNYMKISNETKLTILILLWIFDKLFMVLLFWAIK